METSLQIKIIVPLVPIYRGEEHNKKYVDDAMAELLELDGKLEIELGSIGVFRLTIFIIENYKSFSGRYSINCNAIVFQITTLNNYNSIPMESSDGEQLSDDSKQSLYLTYITLEFRIKIFNFLVLSQIAKPGSIHSRQGEVLINETHVDIFYPLTSMHRESMDEIKKLNWPTYKNLKFLEVWSLFIKNKFSFERHSKSNVERALNTFTHLFNDDLLNIEFDLLWSLIGIEALYCSGKEGLSEQIFHKTQVILGELTDYKKRLKQMYDFRSRLIHGDLDIPPNHYEVEDEENEKYHQHLHDSTILSVAILTATLQTMVYEDKTSLNFKYITV